MQNDKVYASKGCDNIVVQVGNGDKVGKKRKNICNLLQYPWMSDKPTKNTTNCLDLYTVAKTYM